MQVSEHASYTHRRQAGSDRADSGLVGFAVWDGETGTSALASGRRIALGSGGCSVSWSPGPPRRGAAWRKSAWGEANRGQKGGWGGNSRCLVVGLSVDYPDREMGRMAWAGEIYILISQADLYTNGQRRGRRPIGPDQLGSQPRHPSTAGRRSEAGAAVQRPIWKRNDTADPV